MTPALILAFALMTTAPQASDGGGEPLPPGAPADSYELAAWCYGALDEYLTIYDKVKPDLRDMDRMFGTSVVEAEPYQSDMAAAHVELKMIGEAVTDAEKASPRPIAPRGVAAMRQGRTIWSLAEAKTERELARAWMLWALPDACDGNARELATKSLVLGGALTYNTGSHDRPPPPTAPRVAPAPAAPIDGTDAGAEPPPAAGIAAPTPAPEPAVQTPAPAMAAPTPEPEPQATRAALPSSPPAADMGAAPAEPRAEAAPAPTPTAPEVVSVQPSAPAPLQPPPTATAPPDADQSQEPTL
jgi:hypothetical protein